MARYFSYLFLACSAAGLMGCGTQVQVPQRADPATFITSRVLTGCAAMSYEWMVALAGTVQGMQEEGYSHYEATQIALATCESDCLSADDPGQCETDCGTCKGLIVEEVYQ